MLKMSVIWLTGLMVANAELSEKPHPRLWFPQSAEEGLRQKLASDPLAAQLHAAMMTEAEKILTERTCRYDIPDGKRLLRESRRALQNIMHTTWAWRMVGEEKFRLRAITELEAACALKDWNPSHFLDTAEMATAVATGYDWLYPSLSNAQRKTYERAIIDKALKPAKAIYEKGGWWTKPKNNWSQVCGAGIGLAAAAIAGNDENLAEDLFARSLKLVEACEEQYAPDGMYPEGPGYWQYGTNYHVMLLAACGHLGQRTADASLLEKAGDAIMHLTSPTRLPFNFADGNAQTSTTSPAQCWLAAHFKNPTQIHYVRDSLTRALEQSKGQIKDGRYFPLAVLWLPAAPTAKSDLTNAAVFRGEQATAMFRTGWTPDAAWFAIKGGTPAASHGHMDVGSFVYDAHGTRWIHDLGSENYNLPGHFADKRWTYFRLQNRSHNTLEIGGKLQNAASKPCPLIQSTITGNSYSAAFDLTNAYTGSAEKIVRTSHFDAANGSVRIHDEITKPAAEIVWRAFTDAEATLQGDSVILKKGSKQITLRRISPAGTWSITDAKPPTPEEKQNPEFRAIVLTVPMADPASLVVEIEP